jgi:hypothetical protein
MPMPLSTALVMVTLTLHAAAMQVGRTWTFDELTAQADLVVIATHISTEDTGRRRMHPELRPDVRVAELRTDLKVLQVLKGGAADRLLPGATLTVRHYQVIAEGFVNTGSALRFANSRAYLLFLKHQPGGPYEPISGHTSPTDSVFLLARSDKLPLPLPLSLPNMSGTWVLVNASDAPADAARHLEVMQSDKTFAVVATGGALPQSRSYAIGMFGALVGTTGDRTEESATVREESLAIETVRYPAVGAPREQSTWRSEVWSVAGDRLTIHVNERRGDRTVLDATLVYRRRP